jgi:hypothetical protein
MILYMIWACLRAIYNAIGVCGAPYPPLALYVELYNAIPLQGYLYMFRQRQLWWLCWTMTSLQGVTMHHNPGNRNPNAHCPLLSSVSFIYVDTRQSGLSLIPIVNSSKAYESCCCTKVQILSASGKLKNS